MDGTRNILKEINLIATGRAPLTKDDLKKRAKDTIISRALTLTAGLRNSGKMLSEDVYDDLMSMN